MITNLHMGVRPNDYGIAQGRGGGYAQMITILLRGYLGTPKSDYVICARPLMQGASKRTLHEVGNRTGLLLWRRMGRRGLYFIIQSIRVFI